MVDSHLPAVPEILATIPIDDPAETPVAVYSTACRGGPAGRSEGAGDDG
jgi:hypothetical protein